MSNAIVRAADRTAENEQSASHPLNPNSEIRGWALSRAAGLDRVGLWHVRLPPGKESFVYHRHHVEEEFIYVLSGRGVVEIEDEKHEIGAGDFVGFKPGVAHHLVNPFTEDLFYLSGGENRPHEVGDFPRHGKRMVRVGTKVTIYPLDGGEPYPGMDKL